MPLLSDILVGNVIFGKKLCDVIMSRYSLIIRVSVTFSKSMLKSPVIITSPLYLLKLVKIGVSSVLY